MCHLDISNRDMQHCHFLKLRCDIRDPRSRAPLIGKAEYLNGEGCQGWIDDFLRGGGVGATVIVTEQAA